MWGALHLAVICVDGCTDDGAVADLAVVLGNHVGADGTPSMRLQLRLELREPWSWLREVVGFYAYALRRYPA